jgi:hypothetical protein
VTQPAYDDTLELNLGTTATLPSRIPGDDDITKPCAGPGDITSDHEAPRPLPVLRRRRALSWFGALRLWVSELISPHSYADLDAVHLAAEAVLEHAIAEAHWQAHCRDQAALRNWGRAQDELARAAERLLAVRNG